MRLNDKPGALKVGQFVTTEYIPEDHRVVRKVTKIVKDKHYGSGFRACATAGGRCPDCKRPLSRYIEWVDAAWLLPTRRTK